MSQKSRRLVSAAVALAAVLGAGCGAGGTDWQGGLVVDPAGVVVNNTHQLLPFDGQLLRGNGMHTTVDGRTITVTTKAEICSNEPDVVLDVDGQRLRVDLVLPDEGEPCEVDQQHLVTLKLDREFNSYEIYG